MAQPFDPWRKVTLRGLGTTKLIKTTYVLPDGLKQQPTRFRGVRVGLTIIVRRVLSRPSFHSFNEFLTTEKDDNFRVPFGDEEWVAKERAAKREAITEEVRAIY